jgi:hypothetical protein
MQPAREIHASRLENRSPACGSHAPRKMWSVASGSWNASEYGGEACERQKPSKKHRSSLRKPNLRTLTNSATNVERTTANVNGKVEKPKHWGCNSGRDKTYTTNKTSSKVRRTRETSGQTATKAIKDKGKNRRRGGKRCGPSLLPHLKQEEKHIKITKRDNRAFTSLLAYNRSYKC